MGNRMNSKIEKILHEITEFVDNARPAKEKINFKKKQLVFLKANVRKEAIPFKDGLKRLEAKRRKKKESRERKRELGIKVKPRK